MPQSLQEQISAALKPLVDPSLGRLADVAVRNDSVYVTVEVDPAKGTALEDLRQKLQSAAADIAGGKNILVVLTAEKNAPPPPVKKQQTQFSHKISGRPVAPGVRHMIAVASGKGGVGKSTVAANLALALAAAGKKTGLLDADIYGSSQPVMMGIRQKPEMNDSEMIIPLERHGIRIMSMGFFVEPEKPVIWRGPMVHSAIQQLLRDVAWGDLDVLVIDLPPGTGDAQLSLAQYVPLSGAIIVSTPQDVALSEAKKGLRMFEKTNVPVLGMIENMSSHTCVNCGHEEHIFGHGTVARAASEIGVPFLGEIPLQSAIRERADQGTPIVAADKNHPAARAFTDIAGRVWLSLPERKREAG